MPYDPLAATLEDDVFGLIRYVLKLEEGPGYRPAREHDRLLRLTRDHYNAPTWRRLVEESR
jgi:hypothetical protein